MPSTTTATLHLSRQGKDIEGQHTVGGVACSANPHIHQFPQRSVRFSDLTAGPSVAFLSHQL
ncbi:hypothetical protein E2C01_020748 [Portunus trituberculatus]|uniref:Uncharacterized protein n=1 Tax=Portunus trituberculatus TaxID=210409 RepID=A0A5B7E2E0_PORTR|nr:hypothetical protein [Portunus trituberculatus]